MAKVQINQEDLLQHAQELNSNMEYFESIGRPLLEEYSKSTDFKIDYKSIPEYINEMTEKYPDNFAINDKQIELHIKN